MTAPKNPYKNMTRTQLEAKMKQIQAALEKHDLNDKIAEAIKALKKIGVMPSQLTDGMMQDKVKAKKTKVKKPKSKAHIYRDPADRSKTYFNKGAWYKKATAGEVDGHKWTDDQLRELHKDKNYTPPKS